MAKSIFPWNIPHFSMEKSSQVSDQVTRQGQWDGIADQALVRADHFPALRDELLTFQGQGTNRHLVMLWGWCDSNTINTYLYGDYDLYYIYNILY